MILTMIMFLACHGDCIQMNAIVPEFIAQAACQARAEAIVAKDGLLLGYSVRDVKCETIFSSGPDDKQA